MTSPLQPPFRVALLSLCVNVRKRQQTSKKPVQIPDTDTSHVEEPAKHDSEEENARPIISHFAMIPSLSLKSNRPKITKPVHALPLLVPITHAEQECFMVIALDGSHQVISHFIVSIGLANQSQIHPRETYKWAVRENAVGIMVAHNHPSGNLEPSESDLAATRRLAEAGKLLGIPLVDHLIVSTEGFISLRERYPAYFI